jgi:hypothetical protein
MNKPDDEEEIDVLRELIIGFEMGDDIGYGYYGIMEIRGRRLVFGPRNALFLDNEMVEYFLDILEGLRSEMRVE